MSELSFKIFSGETSTGDPERAGHWTEDRAITSRSEDPKPVLFNKDNPDQKVLLTLSEEPNTLSIVSIGGAEVVAGLSEIERHYHPNEPHTIPLIEAQKQVDVQGPFFATGILGTVPGAAPGNKVEAKLTFTKPVEGGLYLSILLGGKNVRELKIVATGK